MIKTLFPFGTPDRHAAHVMQQRSTLGQEREE